MIRWTPLIIAAMIAVGVQATLGGAATLTLRDFGSVGPDLVSALAAYVVLYARMRVDAMLAGWTLGLALDLSTAGGLGGGTVVGPMAIGFAVSAFVLHGFREGFYRDRPLPQGFLAAFFCFVAHVVYWSLQFLLAYKQATWAVFGRRLFQAAAVAVYTGAVMMFPARLLLVRCQKLLLSSPQGRSS